MPRIRSRSRSVPGVEALRAANGILSRWRSAPLFRSKGAPCRLPYDERPESLRLAKISFVALSLRMDGDAADSRSSLASSLRSFLCGLCAFASDAFALGATLVSAIFSDAHERPHIRFSLLHSTMARAKLCRGSHAEASMYRARYRWVSRSPAFQGRTKSNARPWKAGLRSGKREGTVP